MSTNENTSADAESVDQDDNLDLFSEGFFGQKTETPAEAKAEETEDTVDPEADANEEDTHTEDDDTLDTDDESVDEEETPKPRSEEHTSELQSLMRISYAVFCLKKKKNIKTNYKTVNNKSYTHKKTIDTNHTNKMIVY